MKPMNSAPRLLAVVADDFGIGPATSAGILDVAEAGRLTATVLISNSPFAAEGVAQWRARGRPVELGWHPNLTLDRPLLPAGEVPTLVDANGRCHAYGPLLRRMFLGRVSADEVRREWRAQLLRFRELVGHAPRVVNAHQHLHVFPVFAAALADVLADLRPRPWLRRLGEPWSALIFKRGARVKRLGLHACGRRFARTADCPGPDCLLGVTKPPSAAAANFHAAWIARARGPIAELMCHPGRRDETLAGRDCTAVDGWLEQRTNERALLLAPSFLSALAAAQRRLAGVEELLEDRDGRGCRAA